MPHMINEDRPTEPISQAQSFDELKGVFARKAVATTCIFAVPTVLLSVYRAYYIGWQPQMALHLFLGFFYIFLFWQGKRLSDRFIILSVALSFFCITLVSYLFMGLIGAGQLFAIVGLVLVAMLFEFRSLILFSLLTVGSTAMIGWLHLNGRIDLRFDITTYQYETTSWAVAIAALVMMCFVVIAVVHSMVQSLKTNMTRLERRNSQLALAMSELERSDKEKGQLLAITSHELRTPINGMVGVAQILADSELNAEQRGLVERLVRAGSDLTKIVDDSIHQTQIMEGQLDSKAVAFDLSKILDDLYRIYEPRARDKGLKLIVSNSIEVGGFVGDAKHLHGILSNLLSNAVKFSQRGVVRLVASSVGGIRPQLFVVEDEGVGIADQHLEDIFTPFYQIEGGITRTRDGMGLGLSVAKALVEQMGGQISVESAPGKGSSFRVSIALAHAPEQTASDVVSDAKGGKSTTDQLNVLVVEDNRLNALVAEQMLRSLGHAVRGATNGVEGLAIVEEGWPDLVFMDIHMPVMDGVEATEKIRLLPEAQDLPVLALTADAFESHHKEFIAAGMNEVLTKPFNREQLLAAIGRYVD